MIKMKGHRRCGKMSIQKEARGWGPSDANSPVALQRRAFARTWETVTVKYVAYPLLTRAHDSRLGRH